MYNLLEYSNNYSIISRSLLNCHRHKVNDDTIENAADYRINNNKTTTCRSFVYKTKIIGSTSAGMNILEIEVFFPLKDLSYS